VKGPSQFIDLTQVTVANSIRKISAPDVNVVGNVAIANSVGSMTFNDFVDGSIAIGGAERSASLSLRAVFETSITSLAPFSRIKVESWVDSDETADVISTPWIGELSSKAGLPVDLQLSGTNAPRGVALKTFAATSIGNAAWSIGGGVGKARVNGNIDGIFTADVNGNFSSLRVTGSVVDFSATVSGAMSSLTVDGDFVGDLGAASFGTILLKGNVNNSRVLAGADFGPDARIDGAGDVYGVGTIRSLTVRGGMGSSIFAAGLDPVNGIFLDGVDALLAGGRIRRVTVGALEDSRILAADLPPSVSVGGTTLDSTSDVQFRL
jgi:hypothetical protein